MRSRVERQLNKQRDERKRELLRHRIEVAKEGVTLYSKGRYVDAVKRYQHYIAVLEMWKKCGRDGLTPDLFDKKTDIYELVLLSGIYWDLAKLFDKAKREDQRSELTMCLQKYVAFSKGFPYQSLTGEAIRRYMGSGRCKHRTDFRKAYVALTGDRCFIATSLNDLVEEEMIKSLRILRDRHLDKRALGRAFIRAYYAVGPSVARALDLSPEQARNFAAQGVRIAARLARRWV